MYVFRIHYTCIVQALAEVTPLSMVGRVHECLTGDGRQLELFTKMSYGMLECDIVMLQNYMLMVS